MKQQSLEMGCRDERRANFSMVFSLAFSLFFSSHFSFHFVRFISIWLCNLCSSQQSIICSLQSMHRQCGVSLRVTKALFDQLLQYPLCEAKWIILSTRFEFFVVRSFVFSVFFFVQQFHVVENALSSSKMVLTLIQSIDCFTVQWNFHSNENSMEFQLPIHFVVIRCTCNVLYVLYMYNVKCDFLR